MLFRSRQHDALKAEIEALEKENARLRAALEFYASDDAWEGPAKYRDADGITLYGDQLTTAIIRDHGQRARQALRSA